MGFYRWFGAPVWRDNSPKYWVFAMNPRVVRIVLPVAGVLLAAGCGRGPATDKLAAQYTDVVKSYCVECHDSAGQEGGLSLEGVDLNKVAEHADIFEKVARKLRGR